MANLCSTNITIYSKDGNIIEELHKKLEVFINTPFCDEVKRNTSWLGNLLGNAGYAYKDILDGKHGYCRGYVQCINDIETNGEYTTFSADVEDAWSPNIRPWRETLDKLYPNAEIKISWVADEPGCCLYQKYDPNGLFYEDYQFNIDSSVPDEKCYKMFPELNFSCDIYTLSKLKEIFKADDIDTIKARVKSISDALEEKFGSGYFNINEYVDMDLECY